MWRWRVIVIMTVLMNTHFSAISVEILGNRLPKDVVPRKYVIAISPDFINDEFHGAVRIDIHVLKFKILIGILYNDGQSKNLKSGFVILLKPRRYIVLHAKNLTITSTKLYLYKSRLEIPIGSVLQSDEHEMIVINISEEISAEEYFLKINFNGSLKMKINGFYLSTYTDSNTILRKLAVTQFEPFYARTAFPCFDEPSFKSIFLIRLVHTQKPHYHALSNMPIAKIKKLGNETDTRITFFEPSPLMSTYSVAFIVSDFECLVSRAKLSNGAEIPLSICARPMYKERVKFALNLTVRLMEYYMRIFKVDYTLPKLDLVAIPDFAAGAMENWGLITFRETDILYSESHSSCTNVKGVGLTVAHELAHMWFGNLVTMKWWSDLWLNEGFASYMEHKAVDFVLPDWKQMDSFPLYTKYASMKRDCKASVRPIIKYVESNEEIDEMFDRISYQKAAAVIRMLEDTLGNSKFASSIRKYLKRYQFLNAESNQFFETLQENIHNNIDITKFIERWMKLPGFPVVNVRQEDTTFKLYQQRFTINKRSHRALNESWDIPVRYVTSRKEDGVKLDWFLSNFSCVQLSIDKNVEWIKLNYKSSGYFIVNYSEEAWNTFRNLLFNDHRALNPVDRADLLHDAFLLAESTDLCYCTVMNLTSYLINETAYQPWAVATEWFLQMNRLLGATEVQMRFQSYARTLIERVYREVGWNVREEESFVRRELRVLILNAACSIGHKNCLSVAGKKLKNYLRKNGREILPTDIRSIVYSFGFVTQSDDVGSIFENMLRLERRENDAQEKERLMIGLTGIRDRKILSRYIEIASNETYVRRQDFNELLIKIASNPIGLDVVWDFIRSNLDNDGRDIADSAMGKSIVTIVSFFKDEAKLKEVEQFFSRYSNIKATENAKSSAIEVIEKNINWLRENVEKINHCLRIGIECDDYFHELLDFKWTSMRLILLLLQAPVSLTNISLTERVGIAVFYLPRLKEAFLSSGRAAGLRGMFSDLVEDTPLISRR